MYLHNVGSCITFGQVYIFVNVGGLMGNVSKVAMFCQASVVLEKKFCHVVMAPLHSLKSGLK